ncbi:MAG: amidase [Planctomycetes bacterium]|nr:amidase [Planctomycetota bacterium]
MNQPDFGRRDFLKLGAVALGATSCSTTGSHARAEFELEEATIADLQAAMDRGEQTSQSLCSLYLRRIDALDRRGPSLHAVIETNPEALAIAAGLDAERRTRGPRGPLHGIPVLIKDNIATADSMATTAGSLALLGAKAPEDSELARRLRAAGAVILGKTNLSEWANFPSNDSQSGWSGRGGQCRNPYVIDRNPSGSSSGSAAAASASFAAVCVGTETDGSIVSPSSTCGVVGIKPTLGLVSRRGIVPIAESQDTAGPIARTVRDAAILLTAITGVDPKDPVTQDATAIDFAGQLDEATLKGARIGVVRRGLFGYHAPTDAIAEAAIALMRERGAEIVDPVEIPHLREYGRAELEVLLYEFKDGLDRYLVEFAPGAEVSSLAELIAFNERERERELPYFGQETLVRAQAKGPLTEQAYLDALAQCRRLARDEGLPALLAAQKLDAVVAPTTGPAAVIDLLFGDRSLGGSARAAAVSGCPHVTVPAGYVQGLPVGLSFMGARFDDARVIALAHAYEQASKARRTPRFLPTLA